MRKIREAFLILLKGFAMGAADIIPGVSGGTMAYILGIYERLIAAITSFNMLWVKQIVSLQIKEALHRIDWGLLVPLGGGIILAFIFFTKIIDLPGLLITHPQQIYGLFFGLIAGSIYVLQKSVGRMTPAGILFFCMGIGLGLLVAIQVPKETPETLIFVFMSGVVAISAMLMPGVSGSYLLLIMGKYQFMLDAIANVKTVILTAFAGGCVVGLLIFSRIIKWLLNNFHYQTIVTINGFLLGSLWLIWPFQQRTYETIHGKTALVHTSPIFPTSFGDEHYISFGLMCIGLVIVMFLQRKFDKLVN